VQPISGGGGDEVDDSRESGSASSFPIACGYVPYGRQTRKATQIAKSNRLLSIYERKLGVLMSLPTVTESRRASLRACDPSMTVTNRVSTEGHKAALSDISGRGGRSRARDLKPLPITCQHYHHPHIPRLLGRSARRSSTQGRWQTQEPDCGTRIWSRHRTICRHQSRPQNPQIAIRLSRAHGQAS